MVTANSERARIPQPNGRGAITPWQSGQSGNPSGRPKAMKEIRDLCRSASVDAANSLITIVRDTVIDEDGRTHNREDGRVVVLAAQTILTWAYGKPPDYDPREDRPPVTIDTSVLSSAQKLALLDMLRAGLLKESGDPPATEPPQNTQE